MHYALCKAAVYYVCIGSFIFNFFFLFYPEPGVAKPEPGRCCPTRRGARADGFSACVQLNTHCRCTESRGTSGRQARFAAATPGPMGFCCYVRTHVYTYIYIHCTAPRICVCVCVQRTLLFPAGKTRGGQHAINRGREEN